MMPPLKTEVVLAVVVLGCVREVTGFIVDVSRIVPAKVIELSNAKRAFAIVAMRCWR